MRDVRQGEMAECGLAALATLMSHHGVSVDIAEMRVLAASTLYGATATTLRHIAIRYGFDFRASRVDDIARLQDKLPCIVHLRFLHFAVVETIDAHHVLLGDPLAGPIRVAADRFARDFTGVAIELFPTRFLRRSPAPGRDRELGRRLITQALRSGFSTAIALEGASAVAIVAATVLAGRHIDSSTPAGWVAVALLPAATLAVVARHFGAAAARRVARNAFDSAVAYVADSPSHRFILRAPLQFHTMLAAPADLIDTRLIEGCFAATVLVICSLGAIVSQPLLGVAGMVTLAVDLAAGVAMMRARGRHPADSIIADIPVRTPNAGELRDIDRWSIGDGDSTLFRIIAGSQAGGAAAAIRAAERGIWLRMARTAYGGIRVAALLSLGVALARSGAASLGHVFAATMLSTVAGHQVGLVISGSRRPRIDTALHRLADRDDAGLPSAAPADPAPGYALELEKVAWRAAQIFPDVMTNISFRLATARSLALDGPPGSGITTLCRMAAGRLPPTSGEVRRGKSILLEQDSLPVAGSVRHQLSLGADYRDEDMAALLEELDLSRALGPRGGLDLMLSMGAPELSGGQRRRLQLAAALLRKPDLVVIDGVLDSLGGDDVANVLAVCRRRGCALLVSSARLDVRQQCDDLFRLPAAA